MNPVCTGTDYKVFQITVLITDGLMLTTYIPLLFMLAKIKLKGDGTKPIMCACAFFIFFNVSFLISQFIMMVVGCKRDPDTSANDGFSVFFMTSYLMQSYCVLLLSFCRLQFVFKSSSLALGKCTVVTYRIALIAIPTLCALQIIALGNREIAELLLVLAILILTISLVTTMIIFLRKLKLVYGECAIATRDEAFIATITKLAILNITSIATTLMAPIVVVLLTWVFPNGTWVTKSATICYVFAIDAYTNFWCILLSFQDFGHYYTKICGGLDTKCKYLCNNSAGKDEDILAKVTRLQTASSTSAQTSGSVTSNMPAQNTDNTAPEITMTATEITQNASSDTDIVTGVDVIEAK